MELVIFDLDGVIVSTDDYHYKAWKALADKHKLIFNEKINHKLRGVSRAESLKIILEFNGRIPENGDFEAMLETKNDMYKESLDNLSEYDILPGVLELLDSLKKHNIKVAIGSSSKNAPKILHQVGLFNNFDVIVDGNSIKNSKPDPEVFLKCADALNVNSRDCIVFEDASAGIEAALRAGMFACGVGNEHFENAHLMKSTLEGVTFKTLLESINTL